MTTYKLTVGTRLFVALGKKGKGTRWKESKNGAQNDRIFMLFSKIRSYILE